MSTRILSAYFDDVRKGRKEIAEIREFLMDTCARDPVRRGHLLNWLDQAQYEHPIQVTEFLLLRKEIEAAVKNYRDPPADEATVIVRPGSSAGDGATLIAPGATTVAATAMTESTLVDTGATQLSNPQDATPLPERSDHAGLHNAATTMRPPAADTVIQPAPALPDPPRSVTRHYLLWTALPLVTLGLLGVVLVSVWQDGNRSGTQSQTGAPEPAAVAVEETPSAPAPAIQPDHSTTADEAEPEAETGSAPADIAVDLYRSSETGLEQEIRRRAEAGRLLPRTESGSAHFALDVLMQRFPGSPSLLPARIAIKNAHLRQSDLARAAGQWEEAQIHLDAAYAVLQEATTGSAGAP